MQCKELIPNVFMSNSEIRTEPVASARVRILYELLIIMFIEILQMQQSCAVLQTYRKGRFVRWRWSYRIKGGGAWNIFC